MPLDAVPVPPFPAESGEGVTWTRPYFDAAGRAMTGTVTLTPMNVVPATQVPAEVTNGVVTFRVKPGTYRLVAALRTADRLKVWDYDTVEIS